MSAERWSRGVCAALGVALVLGSGASAAAGSGVGGAARTRGGAVAGSRGGAVAGLRGGAVAGSRGGAVQRARANIRRWGGTWVEPLDPTLPALLRSAAGERRAKTAGAAPAAGSDQKARSQVLSNETTFTRWAYVNQIEPIYARPTTSSASVARLRWGTESGLPQTYVLLRANWDAEGREWVKVRIPMRPNGRTGWVQRDALDAFHLTHLLIVVDREQLRLSLYSDGRLIWHAPVAVGKPSTPTPPGSFWITERFKIEDPSSGYYPYAFGTSDYSTLTDWPEGGVVGIHGPYYQPQLIPGRISHGCIRLSVANDEWLAQHIALGTPVHIL